MAVEPQEVAAVVVPVVVEEAVEEVSTEDHLNKSFQLPLTPTPLRD